MAWSGSQAESIGMRWWGWGDPMHPPVLSPSALAALRKLIPTASAPHPPVALERVELPASRLDDELRERLLEVVGAEGLSESHLERVTHAAGKSYTDLVRMRKGSPEGAPDAIVSPQEHAQVLEVLRLCSGRSVAVVPFGGGTSVVGGLAPLRGSHETLIALDMRRMQNVLDLDLGSRIVTVQAGLRVAELESWLGSRGLTLGHFPQSFQYVSVGGCAATRSVGQESTGYGGIERMVLGLRLATPTGELELAAVPASAAGPGLRGLAIGSEGTLGVLTELSLRVRRAPSARRYEGIFFKSFHDGLQALRRLAQDGRAPALVRLSDEPETRMSLALAGGGGLKAAAGRAYLRVRGYSAGCLAILGFEGEPDRLRAEHMATLELLAEAGPLGVGSSPGEAWAASRYSAPYMRDELLTHGVMVETLETATRWSNVEALHGSVSGAIAQALRDRGTPGLVLCHVSHLYETGASLYFTFLASQQEDREIEQWQAVKGAASEAILAGGGTITHHHAVGRDHAPWMRQEVGEQGLEALRALKAQLDPNGIMNPGKLLESPRL